jgi:alkylation response protein AidB-like acyl-CoA dehydrogenase
MDESVVAAAQGLADEVLFPAALATDRAEVLPVELLDALADAGFYGLAAPRSVGGLAADFETTCAVVEALASGCLTTAFVWAQHLGAVHAVAQSGLHDLQEAWLETLARGTTRAGLALGGALPQPTLQAVRDADELVLTGESPWLSGWGRIDVVHTAARTEDGNVVWLLVDADQLSVEPLELVAIQASATVRARFDGVRVRDERVTGAHPYTNAPTPREVLRIHAAFALGIVRRCSMLLGASSFDGRLEALRAELDTADSDIAFARAAAAELAFRAAATCMVEQGSRAVLRSENAQRLGRESLFLLVYALRPPVRSALLGLLSPPPSR